MIKHETKSKLRTKTIRNIKIVHFFSLLKVTPDLRLCLLNVTVTPNVFDDIHVRISPKLPDQDGHNSEEYTD